MKKWKKNQWWIGPVGIILTFLIGIFPRLFNAIGETLKWLFTIYWSHISQGIIIGLLLSILILLLKQQKQKQKSDSSV